MKKIFSVLFALVLATSFVAAQAPAKASAQGFGVSWDSSFQVMNLSTTAIAAIDTYYYKQDGSLATMDGSYSNPDHDTVAIGASNTYYPIHAAAGFNGSVVINSTEDVAVISNIVIGTAQKGLGSYVAFKSGASKIYFPLLMKGNANNTSTFNVQNTGSDAADITIHFSPMAGGGFPAITDITANILAGAAKTYDLGTLSVFSAVTKWVGGATVTVTDTANDSVAGVANTVSVKFPTAYALGTYNAFTAGSTKSVIPLIQENNNGNRTSVNCLNLGVATSMKITYTPSAGSPAKAAQTTAVGAGGMTAFIQDYTGSVKFLGSAVVSTTPAVNIACVVNQQKPATGTLSTYEGFNPANASGTVLLPLIQSRNGTAANGYVYTSINLATSDGAAHAVKCDFKPSPTFTDPADVTGNAKAIQFLQNDIYGTGAKFVGGAICTITDASGAGLFAVVNQTRQNTPVTPRDTLSTYDGFNQ